MRTESSAGDGIFQRSIAIRAGEAEAIAVEMPQWDRIKRRVESLEDLRAIGRLVAGASVAALAAGLYFQVKKAHANEGADIIDEMEAYERSFGLTRERSHRASG